MSTNGGDDGIQEIQITGGSCITLEQTGGPCIPLEQKEWLKETRKLLVVLATLATSVTYQAGLNPPGGFWHGDGNGNQMMYDYVVPRYLTFYCLNATAFVTSLVIVTLLLSKRFYNSEAKVASLILITLVDLMSLVGAYTAGSTRVKHSSIYIIVVTCFLFVCLIYIIYISRMLPILCSVLLFMSPPLARLAEKGWLPVTDTMNKRVEMAKMREKAEEDKEKGKTKTKSKKNRCLCCGC